MTEDGGYGIYFVMGLFTGIIAFAFAIAAQKVAMRRSLKEYLFSLSPESRKSIDEEIDSLFSRVENLAVKTNTRLFKSMYNDYIQLRVYLSRMWRQN